MAAKVARATISVVIPTRNRLPMLKEAIASVEAQTYPDWELVLVDDNSSDGTPDWLRTLEDNRVRVVTLPEHSERSEARNRGLQVARSDYVIFLDDDDRLTPRALARLYRALSHVPIAVGAVGARIVVDGAGNRRRVSHPRLPMVKNVWAEVLLGWIIGQGQFLIRTAVVARAGGWNPSLVCAEDQDLWLRLSRLGPVVMVPFVVLENRLHSGQWRPPDVQHIHEAIRSRHIAHLDEKARHRAQMIARAHSALAGATAAYAEGRYSPALAGYREAFWTVPRLLFSPMTGPGLLTGMTKALAGVIVGSTAMGLARSCIRSLRRLFGRQPS